MWPEKAWFEIQKLDSKSNIDLDLNGFSVIQLLSYGNFKALLTGAAGKEVQLKAAIALMGSAPQQKADTSQMASSLHRNITS